MSCDGFAAIHEAVWSAIDEPSEGQRQKNAIDDSNEWY